MTLLNIYLPTVVRAEETQSSQVGLSAGVLAAVVIGGIIILAVAASAAVLVMLLVRRKRAFVHAANDDVYYNAMD